MQQIGFRSQPEQIAYHLADGRAIEFEQTQPGRIDLARFLINKILSKHLTQRPLTFVELGCGAGDITGPYAQYPWQGGITAHGYDVVPAAEVACSRRWPQMLFTLGEVENVEPFDCDILVMCEFLEHVTDPIKIVKDWMPRAKWSIIGHPLNDPDPSPEPGHIWSYTEQDWLNWFEIGGHQPWERFKFPMGGWPDMILGHGSRLDQV